MRAASLPWIRGFLPGVALVVALQVVAAANSGWPASTGEFWGPDSYMRLERTLVCDGGSACPDGVFADTNAPFGEVLHWPFLEDRILLALAAPMTPVVGRHEAVLIAASLFGPLLAIGAVALVLLAARTVVPRPGLYFVGALMACQPWVFQAFAAPQVDHHGLQGLLFLGMLAGALQVLADPRGRRWPLLTGLFLGLALWVSTEALVSCLPVIVGLGLLWVVRGGKRAARANRDVGLTAVAVLTVGLLVDGPPGHPLAAQYDRFSVVHWVVFAFFTLGWWAAEQLESRRQTRPRTRLWLGLAGVLAWSAAIAATFPDFFGGPMVHLDPRLAAIWLDQVSEFVPIVDQSRAYVVWLHLASALVAIPTAVVCAMRAGPRGRSRWWLLVGTCAWFTGLAVFVQGRWALYLHLLVSIPLAWLLGRLLGAASRLRAPLIRPAVNVASAVGFAALPLLFAVPFAGAEAVEHAGAGTACTASGIVPTLRDLELTRGAGTVLAPADWGPEIVFKTGHRAVASPYHRNAEGLLDSYAFMSATDQQAARSIAARRGIDWIVMCTGRPWFPVVESDARETLYGQLSAGDVPPWLRVVALPDSLARSFRIFEVA